MKYNVYEMTSNDRFLLHMAYMLADAKSDDPSTQNAAIIVPSGVDIRFKQFALSGCASGANRFPEGVEVTRERLIRETKLRFIIHAERSAIFAAARDGISTSNSIMYCPFACCMGCSQAIIAAGIGKVVVHKELHDKIVGGRWEQEVNDGIAMLEDAGVAHIQVTGKVGNCRNLFDGKYWEP